jgi:hypothetical protein
MTRPARFTSADVERAIRAARKAGVLIGGAKIEPDGTIVVLAAPPGGIPANVNNPLERHLNG